MLYHYQIGFPNSLRLAESYDLNIRLSLHAQQACSDDRYGMIKLGSSITFERKQIIEVETIDNKIPVKLVIRVPYNNDCDLIVAIATDNNNTVKTVWLNKKCDGHRTLDRSKYSNPQQQQQMKAALSKIKF